MRFFVSSFSFQEAMAWSSGTEMYVVTGIWRCCMLYAFLSILRLTWLWSFSAFLDLFRLRSSPSVFFVFSGVDDLIHVL